MVNIHNIILSKARLRQIEDFYQKNKISLMVQVGKALAKNIIKIAKKEKINLKQNGKPVLILCGRGNNGGDALELASIFSQQKIPIVVVNINKQNPTNFQSPDYKIAYNKFIKSGGIFTDIEEIAKELTTTKLPKYSLIVDGIFGIGYCINRAEVAQTKANKNKISAEFSAIQLINKIKTEQRIKVVAIDIASGLDSESGRTIGEDTNGAVFADWSISLIAHKLGMFTNLGPSYSGEIILETLAVEKKSPQFYLPPKNIKTSEDYVITISSSTLWQNKIPRRMSDFHKGQAGNVVVYGGVPPMFGAGELVAFSALAMGCGRVYLQNFSNLQTSQYSEIIYSCPEPAQLNPAQNVVVVGPGLGLTNTAKNTLKKLLLSKLILIVDADALTLIADDGALAKILAQRGRAGAATIITPHPLEAGRLLNLSVDDVQNNRRDCAIALSKKYQCFSVLKGCGTISVSENAIEMFIANGSASALATAGSGDVLAGAMGALIAQTICSQPPITCNNGQLMPIILMAVDIHLQAGQYLAQKKNLCRGALASEIVYVMRKLYNRYLKKLE